MDKIIKLQEIIDESKSIVVLTGAGESTESGLKDFRSSDGIYNKKYDYNPEEILSHHFFINNTKEFYDFYRKELNPLGYKPNSFHYFLKELEDSSTIKPFFSIRSVAKSVSDKCERQDNLLNKQ